MIVLLGLDLSARAAAAVAVPTDWDMQWQRVASLVVGAPLRRDASDAERAARTETIARRLVGFAQSHGCRPKEITQGVDKCGSRSTFKSRDDAAAILGVGPQEARALETVFTTPGVPDELKAAVNKGTVAPTRAAKAVRTEAKRQGGEIKDTAALKAVAEKPKRQAGWARCRGQAPRTPSSRP